MKNTHLIAGIEPLEARIAPAMVTLHIVNPHTATYTDVDGDHVTVKVSAGTLIAGLFTGVASGLGDQLQRLDLSGGGFDKANLTFSVAKVTGGNGFTDVGHINSTGHDLGKVTVKGDLGQINAGDAITKTPGLKLLSTRSLGVRGAGTQPAGTTDPLHSAINGALGSLAVTGDVKDAFVDVTGGTDGRIGAITIGGSLIGGQGSPSGAIFSEGNMGPVKITLDVQGGPGSSSGIIHSNGKLASATVGGSLAGGSQFDTGEISSDGDMGAVKIHRDLQGDAGSGSGLIHSGGKLAGVTIDGSLKGGSAPGFQAVGIYLGSGEIWSYGDMGTVKIGHDLQGDAGIASGLIFSKGKLAGVTIGGSLLGGRGPGTQLATNEFLGSGEILSDGDMGAVKVGKDVTGGPGKVSAVITSQGKLAGATIGGSLTGGSDAFSGVIASQSSMGLVKIGGNIQGGIGDQSGVVGSGTGNVAGVIIGGSLLGGRMMNNITPTFSGGIFSGFGKLGPVKIAGNLEGGEGKQTGLIRAKSITSVFIGGSITSSASDYSGWISADNDIGAITVKGSITGTASNHVVISGGTSPAPTATRDIAIKSIAVTGAVSYVDIRAGYVEDQASNLLTFQDANAQIGSVTVGGNWDHGRLSAGAAPGPDNVPGTSDDILAGTISKIASIVIKGFATGGSNDFMIDSGKIGSLTVHAVRAPLTAGADNLNFNGSLPLRDLR